MSRLTVPILLVAAVVFVGGLVVVGLEVTGEDDPVATSQDGDAEDPGDPQAAEDDPASEEPEPDDPDADEPQTAEGDPAEDDAAEDDPAGDEPGSDEPDAEGAGSDTTAGGESGADAEGGDHLAADAPEPTEDTGDGTAAGGTKASPTLPETGGVASLLGLVGLGAAGVGLATRRDDPLE